MATISSGRWDWWNEYTEKDKIVDCLMMLSDAMGRWPEYEEVAEVWPEYTLNVIQAKFGSYDLAKAAVGDKAYRMKQGYSVRRSPVKLAFTEKQARKVAEIAKRPLKEKSVVVPVATPIMPTAVPESAKEVPLVRTAPEPAKEVTIEALSESAGENLDRPKKTRSGRRPTFSDEQLLMILRKIVIANGGEVPTTAQAKALLREQEGAPSLMTMTNRLGPISTWESRLERNAG